MSGATEIQRISARFLIWQAYDSAVRSELFSTAAITAQGTFLIDPIPLAEAARQELLHLNPVAGIIVTNSNHVRASTEMAEQFSIPIFAHSEAFASNQPTRFVPLEDGDSICEQLLVITVGGAVSGEIALYYPANGGALIVGDALINFEPYQFTFLPAKYCFNQKEMQRSLRKLTSYKAERMFFAHGTPISSGASTQLLQLLEGDL
jgi:glyoxylase-like metal-dependent hydrolase (beta-lactamase superfamily II)